MLRICRSWREGCAAAALDVRGDVDAMSASEQWAALNDAYQRGRIDVEAFVGGFSEMVGGLYSPDEILRVHLGWTLGEYEGVGDVVDRIHAAGVETAVLSNTSHDHWEIMPQYPAWRKLRNKLASHLLAIRKPDAAAYRAVQEHTGFAGAEILFFDDLPENVEAARRFGWRAEQIDPSGSTAEQIDAALVAHGVLGRA